MPPTVLMVPGFTGSGPGHWQSLWRRNHPEYRRVEQRDWDHPEPVEWVAALDRAVRETPGRVVLVGHSLGCVTIARWARTSDVGRIGAVMLVAPSDVEAPSAPSEVRGFAPIPLDRLPFPTLVVTSTNDPLITLPRAQQFASRWGARLASIGAADHIHTAAGFGPWPQGHALLESLIRVCLGENPRPLAAEVARVPSPRTTEPSTLQARSSRPHRPAPGTSPAPPCIQRVAATEPRGAGPAFDA